ncbi:FtsX-like permease family protein [Sulfurimonas aquatica]|uniref:FtsX-like permease family protein n=1 Tax=Sulfurimonas aquatica TaxID=2672570 RepID=A0A975B0K4_9BACT|nr:FtsX-like permease family protein [Sulfurimonas aquatica]QSZ42017.1 FtsX-like permease family protein [Sulfurimonas aquatica]
MYSLIFKLAFSNAFLRLNRTILLILMISVSMSMMISIQGLYDGMTLSLIDKSKRSDSGEISVYGNGYRLDKSLSNNIHGYQQLKNELQDMEDIKRLAFRLKADGLISTARKSSFATMIGIDLKEEEKFGKFSEFLVEGELSLGKRDILLSKEVAKNLKVKVGSKIIFSTQDSSGEINAMALKVKALITTNNIALDSSAIYINRERLRKFLSLSNDIITQVAIRSDSETLKELLTQKYNKLDVKSFLELYPMIQQMQDMMLIFNSITFVIVMSVVFIGIMGVMYVSILDRIREFGIMRSIGLSYRLIRLQIFSEAIFLGLAGYLFGALFGFGALYYLHSFGLDLSEFSDGMESFGMSSVIYAQIKIDYFSSTFIAILLASLISVLPARKKIKTMNSIEVTKVET